MSKNNIIAILKILSTVINFLTATYIFLKYIHVNELIFLFVCKVMVILFFEVMLYCLESFLYGSKIKLI